MDIDGAMAFVFGNNIGIISKNNGLAIVSPSKRVILYKNMMISSGIPSISFLNSVSEPRVDLEATTNSAKAQLNKII